MPRVTIHWAWVILAVCFADVFINFAARLGYGLVLPQMLGPLELSRTSGGTIYNSYLFVYLIFTPLAGYLNDRVGSRAILTLCSLILGLGLVGLGAAHSLGWASAAFGLAGLGATGMWAPLIALVQRWFAPRRRGLALGILSTSYGLGLACLGMVFPLIVASLSWRWAWWILGGAALVMVLFNGLFVRSSPEALGVAPWGRRQPYETALPPTVPTWEKGLVRAVLKGRLFWLVGFSYYCVVYAAYGITTFMVDYAQHSLGIPMAQASQLATVHGLAQVAGVLVLLPLSDRWGRRNMILVANGLVAAVVLGILLWGVTWGALVALVGVLAFCFGAIFPMYGACAGDYFPRPVMGTVVGMWTVFNGLAAVTVHWVAGALRDSTGGYDISFAIDAVMAALGLALMLLVPNHRAHGS
ncbi:MAG: MFS transporter [Desulfarculus sp.]|nr:MFS transporter [Pseudomonadota bacterium]MBV1714924.1 MFS transporter [Desulfarculus sp.]MBU4576707.1 MFS transporter [Pseudomonadota bacterium]MBU4599023.1 MFS transporter [Pseudomonadota bacterium]MBV1737424.1 MFS transporter [Desulfarculus sp.]